MCTAQRQDASHHRVKSSTLQAVADTLPIAILNYATDSALRCRQLSPMPRSTESPATVSSRPSSRPLHGLDMDSISLSVFRQPCSPHCGVRATSRGRHLHDGAVQPLTFRLPAHDTHRPRFVLNIPASAPQCGPAASVFSQRRPRCAFVQCTTWLWRAPCSTRRTSPPALCPFFLPRYRPPCIDRLLRSPEAASSFSLFPRSLVEPPST